MPITFKLAVAAVIIVYLASFAWVLHFVKTYRMICEICGKSVRQHITFNLFHYKRMRGLHMMPIQYCFTCDCYRRFRRVRRKKSTD